jgi:hypothetical protein
VTNIQRGAEIIDGTIVGPGERFSLNDVLGRRTIERGFVEAPQIYAGRLEDAVGGGVSQIATTTYNAAFFAGVQIVTHQPHEFYISRYPMGREATVSWGGPELPSGRGPARTGVTAVLPHAGNLFREKVVAGVFTANGVGEVVGSTAIREWGVIETPIMLTNSQAVGQVYDTTVRWVLERDPLAGIDDAVMPVVGECDDGSLNDARGMHGACPVRDAHSRLVPCDALCGRLEPHQPRDLALEVDDERRVAVHDTTRLRGALGWIALLGK